MTVRTRYEYRTVAVVVAESWIGWRTDRHTGVIGKIAAEFDALADDGWEFVTMSPVPIVGKLMRLPKDNRAMTVAVFRRPKKAPPPPPVVAGPESTPATKRRGRTGNAPKRPGDTIPAPPAPRRSGAPARPMSE